MVHLSGTFLKFVLMLLVNMVFCQTKLIDTSDQSAREGDAEVVIPCNFSQFTDTAYTIDWNEVDEIGMITIDSIVNEKRTENGRYSLRTDSGNADLVISKPMRNDSQRFQCRIQNSAGETLSNVSILTVYYLDDPVLKGPNDIIYEGEPVTLTCSIPDGEPTPNITWYKDAKPMSNNNVTTNGTMSVLHIKKSNPDNTGKYSCKVESNEYKGNDGKTSAIYQLILYYLSIEFKADDKFVTCDAEGHPKPVNVTMMQDGEEIENGKDRAMVEINDEICKSNLTCYAENGELGKTEELKICEVSDDVQDSGFQVSVIIVIVLTFLLTLWVFVLCYFVHYKKIEWESGEDVKAVEDGDPVTMTWRYRPSVARFKSFQLYKDDVKHGSAQQQFSRGTLFLKYILYCSIYLCGIVCCEYSKKKNYQTSMNSKEESHEMIERENRDGQSIEDATEVQTQPHSVVQTEANPAGGETSTLIVGTETKGGTEMRLNSSKPSFTNERGMINMKIEKPTRSDSGTYKCQIEGGRQQQSIKKALHIQSPFKMKIPDVVTNHRINCAKLVLELTDKDESTKITNISWYKEDTDKGNLLISLKEGTDKDFLLTLLKEGTNEESVQASVKDSGGKRRYNIIREKNSKVILCIKGVVHEDAGKYICEVNIEDGIQTYKCSGQLKVKDPILHLENVKRSVAGEDVRIWYRLSQTAPPIQMLRFHKMKSGAWKEIATSDSKRKSFYDAENNEGFWLIPKVEIEDAGTYRCQCVIDENVTYSVTCELQVDEKEYIKMDDYFAVEGGKAVIVCVYKIEDKLKAVKWYKKTSSGKQLISAAEKDEINEKIKETKERLTIEYSSGATRIEINNVSVEDAGKYICQLERFIDIDSVKRSIKRKRKLEFTASAELCVPWTIFGGKANKHRHPAVVFLNSHFLVFGECGDLSVIKKGKLTEKSSIKWNQSKTLLKESNASFQNLVPIVTDKEQGHLILMCIRKSTITQEKKLIMKQSDDNGENWSERKDVKVRMENVPTNILDNFYIGPGHGVRLQSGKLVVSGVSEQETGNLLFVLTSEDAFRFWDIVQAPSALEFSLGMHTQVTEYSNDHVCISCSSINSKQRFHAFSNDGCKTFENAVLAPTLKEANPGCQAGIVSVPMNLDTKYSLTAFTNPSSSEKFENLTVHLSEDGCKTWTKFSELGTAYTKDSDLAYYEVKNENKISRGLACVYETGSHEKDCSIVMQLIPLDENFKKGKFKFLK